MNGSQLTTHAAHGPERRGAMGRALMFLAVAAAMIALCFLTLTHLFGAKADFDHPTLRVIAAVQAALVLLTVLLPAGLLRLFTHEPAELFGWGRPPRLRQFLSGVVGGGVLMALALGAIASLGGLHFAAPILPPLALVGYGLAYALIFVLVGISEEGLLRAYPLIQLSRAFGFWPAAIVTSLIFMALHLGHSNETAIGLTQVALFGLLMAMSVRRTGGIWFALGFHTAWDFTETFLFGVPDSGAASSGSLITSTFSGPAWLTGGTAGPEGSLAILLPLGLLWLWLRSGRWLGQGAPSIGETEG